MMTNPLRSARILTGTGLVLTLALAVWPFLTPGLLADHIRAGYPEYSAAEVGSAVVAWQAVLASVAGLGVLGWLWTFWSLRRPNRWAPFSATALLAVAVVVTLVLLLTPDTSGEVGLAPALGWAWLVPCLAGLAVTITAWRGRAGVTAPVATP